MCGFILVSPYWPAKKYELIYPSEAIKKLAQSLIANSVLSKRLNKDHCGTPIKTIDKALLHVQGGFMVVWGSKLQ